MTNLMDFVGPATDSCPLLKTGKRGCQMPIKEGRSIAAGLSRNCRELLIAHVDGGIYVHVGVSLTERRLARRCLFDLGLIRAANYGDRPHSTKITEKGRGVLCAVLAEYAEALMRAGCEVAMAGGSAVAVDARRLAKVSYPSVLVRQHDGDDRRLVVPRTAVSL